MCNHLQRALRETPFAKRELARDLLMAGAAARQHRP
jgi:hypothetical protein